MLQSQLLSAGSLMTPWLPKANDVQLGIGTSWALPYEDSTKDLASSYYCPICQASAERWSRWEYLIWPAGGNSVTKFLPNGTNTKTTREIWWNTLHTPFDTCTSSCETFSILLHKWNNKILTTVVRSIHMSMISIKINNSVNLQIGLDDNVSHGPHLQPPHLMCLLFESVCQPPSGHHIPLPTQQSLVQAALTMQGMTFHGQNQIFKRLEPTMTDHPAYLLAMEGRNCFCWPNWVQLELCVRTYWQFGHHSHFGACPVQSQQPDCVWC